LQWLTTKTILKGQSSHSIFYKKLDTSYLKKGSDLSKPPKANKTLTQKEKKTVCSIPTPTSRQIREFLKMAGFWQIWIPNFSLLTKPLYKATEGVGVETKGSP
jgi:hypothetical protein